MCAPLKINVIDRNKRCLILIPPSPVASAPSNLTAVQEGPTGIRVSWTPPNPLGDTTGYRIYYSGGSSGSEDVSGGSTHNELLTGLQNGASYNISIVGTSDHLYSERVEFRGIIELCKRSIFIYYQLITIIFFVFLVYTVTAPGMPVTSISNTTLTTISLSWTTASGTVDSYEVMWERDTSGECPDVVEGNATVIDGSNSYTIMRLEKGNRYTITVTATNIAGSTTSDSVTGVTGEAGEGLVT